MEEGEIIQIINEAKLKGKDNSFLQVYDMLNCLPLPALKLTSSLPHFEKTFFYFLLLVL